MTAWTWVQVCAGLLLTFGLGFFSGVACRSLASRPPDDDATPPAGHERPRLFTPH